MAVFGLCVLTACTPQSPLPEAPTSTAPAPVSALPGLATSEPELLRDDTIAYWEAWKRGSLTAACMEDAGYTWHLEADFPEDRVSEITTSLGVARVGADDGTPPNELNAASYAALDSEDRDRYALALWGESAEDIDQLIDTGAAPEGRDDSFAMGGCLGAAKAEIGSVWDLKGQIGPDLAGRESEITDDHFEHKNLVDAHIARYADAMAKISADGAFLAFLATTT